MTRAVDVKLTLVILLTAFHVLCSKWVKSMAAGTLTIPSRHFRLINEIPTLLLIAIVCLAVFKSNIDFLCLAISLSVFGIFIFMMVQRAAKTAQKG